MNNDLSMNAAIYSKAVCDVCVNCPHKRCLDMDKGCEVYRQAMAAHRKHTIKPRRRRKEGHTT